MKPIADWVEKERDLTFVHPVEVDFMSAARYERHMSGSDEESGGDESGEETGEGSGGDEMTPDDFVAVLRALGLADGKVEDAYIDAQMTASERLDYQSDAESSSTAA